MRALARSCVRAVGAARPAAIVRDALGAAPLDVSLPWSMRPGSRLASTASQPRFGAPGVVAVAAPASGNGGATGPEAGDGTAGDSRALGGGVISPTQGAVCSSEDSSIDGQSSSRPHSDSARLASSDGGAAEDLAEAGLASPGRGRRVFSPLVARRGGGVELPLSWESSRPNASPNAPVLDEVTRLVKAGDAAGAVAHFEGFLARGLEAAGEDGAVPKALYPPMASWRVYLVALRAAGAGLVELRRAKELMAGPFGATPHTAVYVALLEAAGREGDGPAALDLLAEMQRARLEVTTACKLHAAQALLSWGGDGAAALGRVLLDLGDTHLFGATLESYRRLAQRALPELRRARRFSEAAALLRCLETHGEGLRPKVAAELALGASLAGDGAAAAVALDVLLSRALALEPFEARTRGLLLDEGSLLVALRAAASLGDRRLAEVAWASLRLSLDAPTNPSAAALARAKEAGASRRGSRQPAVAAFHALVHALAVSGDLSGALERVAELASVYASHPALAELLSPASALAPLVDVLSMSTATVDDAYFLLEDWAAGHNSGAVADVPSGLRRHGAAARDATGLNLPISVDGDADGPGGGLAGDPAVADGPWTDDGTSEATPAPLTPSGEVSRLAAPRGVGPRPLHVAQLNAIIAACCQLGDLERGFDSLCAAEKLGLDPDAAGFESLAAGCVEVGRADLFREVREMQEAAGIEAGPTWARLCVEMELAAGDLEAALQELDIVGKAASPDLLERVLLRAERAGDDATVAALVARLEAAGYQFDEARELRWRDAGGLARLFGADNFVPRERFFARGRQ